jgi:hypothetical protein
VNPVVVMVPILALAMLRLKFDFFWRDLQLMVVVPSIPRQISYCISMMEVGVWMEALILYFGLELVIFLLLSWELKMLMLPCVHDLEFQQVN